MGEGVDDGGADTKAGKRARTRHESDFANITPGVVVFYQLGMDKC